MCIAELVARWVFVVKKLCNFLFYLYRKWPIVSLDKTLIPRLGSCRALWSCTETAIWTFNPLVPVKVHYREKNPGFFTQILLISFRLKKERHEHLGWHGGWVHYSKILILDWNWSFKAYSLHSTAILETPWVAISFIDQTKKQHWLKKKNLEQDYLFVQPMRDRCSVPEPCSCNSVHKNYIYKNIVTS